MTNHKAQSDFYNVKNLAANEDEMNQQWLCCYKQHIYGYKDTFTPKVVAVRLQLKEVCGCNYIIW